MERSWSMLNCYVCILGVQAFDRMPTRVIRRQNRHRLCGVGRGGAFGAAVKVAFLGVVVALLGGCGAAGGDDEGGVSARALELAQRHLIVDTHVDAPYRHYRNPVDLGEAAPDREFDYPRARGGGLDVAFMSIYTPPSAADSGTARVLAEAMVDGVYALAAKYPARFALATCVGDVSAPREAGVVLLALGMENGSPLAQPPPGAQGADADLEESVRHFYERGIRYVTLAHAKSNEYSDSSYDENERWDGLSDAGRALVAALNAHGVMIDISHLSDKAAWQVIERSAVPVIATHSSLRHFVPDFHRNMADDMLKAMAAQGGVLQINFGSGFVSEPARRWADERAAWLAGLGDQVADETARRTLLEEYRRDNPYPYATIDTVLDHFDRVVELAGVKHVGLGSDFDGVGDTLPIGLKDVGDYPALIDGLLQRGYDEDAIADILGRNLMRVWRMVERHAEQAGNPARCRSA